jgi:phage FluMu protein Com
MKKCPKCNNFSVAFDAYRMVDRCMLDGCSCIVIDTSTYSYLKADPPSKSINRVKVENGAETAVMKRFKLA